MDRISLWFIRAAEVPVPLRALLKEHGRAIDRATYLASRRAVEAQAASVWAGHVQSLFHPITCSDGSYWRGGRWNARPKSSTYRREE